MQRYFGFTFLILLLFLSSCNKESSTEPENNILALPELKDSIPYDILGTGKIVFERIGPSNNNYSGIYIIDFDNKKNQGLKLLEMTPQVSPEGDKIVFTTLTNYPAETYWDVYLMDINGTNKKQISSIKGQEACPTWLPDNNRIIFYSNLFNAGNGSYIPAYLYNCNTKSLSNVIDFVTIRYPQELSPRDIISVSKNDVCLISNYDGLCTFNLDGSKYKTILKRSAEYSYYSATWSPDGNRIAFMAIKPDSSFHSKEMNIITINSGGGDSTKIYSTAENEESTWSGNNNYSLCWSPDGNKILFNKREGNFTTHIYLINKDGTGLTKITSSSEVTDRSLSWGK
ncbi:MAG: hypothetical protein C4539_18535 [Ignavibacteriales bacterium]|nr:MAG: hypothetical protein C4539_18535 [Ignavibacteriales bacterium]